MKEYYEKGKILFEGESKENARWNGKVYDENGEIIDEIKEGKSLKKRWREKRRKGKGRGYRRRGSKD